MPHGAGGVELTVSQQQLQAVRRAFRNEGDGKHLQRDLTKQLKLIMEPAAQEVKSAITSMPVKSPATDVKGPSMRVAMAQQIKVSVRYSGRSTGVSVRAAKDKYPRNFKSAPHNFNAAKGWRHPTFGQTDAGHWVDQSGAPNFFDGVLRPKKFELMDAVDRAVKEMADRIAHQIH